MTDGDYALLLTPPARPGPYRVVYDIDEQARRVTVVRIDHRTDVYRPRA